MPKGALDALREQREAEWARRMEGRSETPVADTAGRLEKAKGILKAHRAPVRSKSYFDLAERIRLAVLGGASITDVSQMLSDALGGAGGKARAAKLSSARKSEIARNAAKAKKKGGV